MEVASQSSSDHEVGQDSVVGETSITRWPYFPLTISTLFASIVLSGVMLTLNRSFKARPTDLYFAEHRQLYSDWTSQPFVEVKVESASSVGGSGCSEADGFEPIFTRMWNGTQQVCRVNFLSISVDNPNSAVHTTQFKVMEDLKKCDGELTNTLPRVNMTKQFNDVVVCARRAGTNFIDSVRIDPRKDKCPGALLPCATSDGRQEFG